MTTSSWFSKGFLLAGAVNIFGMLLFSLGFSNPHIAEHSPQVFSTFGQGVVLLWGLAYIAVATCYREARWVVAVFVVEKLVYFVTWIVWISQHGSELSAIFDRSPLTGTFFAIYGPNDLLFGLFFAGVFVKTRQN